MYTLLKKACGCLNLPMRVAWQTFADVWAVDLQGSVAAMVWDIGKHSRQTHGGQVLLLLIKRIPRCSCEKKGAAHRLTCKAFTDNSLLCALLL